MEKVGNLSAKWKQIQNKWENLTNEWVDHMIQGINNKRGFVNCFALVFLEALHMHIISP